MSMNWHSLYLRYQWIDSIRKRNFTILFMTKSTGNKIQSMMLQIMSLRLYFSQERWVVTEPAQVSLSTEIYFKSPVVNFNVIQDQEVSTATPCGGRNSTTWFKIPSFLSSELHGSFHVISSLILVSQLHFISLTRFCCLLMLDMAKQSHFLVPKTIIWPFVPMPTGSWQ